MPRKSPSPYGSDWRRVRREVLERDDFRCYVDTCTRPATTVDHIIPLAEAPHLRLERGNLRASCVPHNSGRVSGRLAAQARMNRSPATVRPW